MATKPYVEIPGGAVAVKKKVEKEEVERAIKEHKIDDEYTG
jgi:hypothetical protein